VETRLKVMRKMLKMMMSLSAHDRSMVAFDFYRQFYQPMTAAERAANYRARHARVTEERHAAVTEPRHADVTETVTRNRHADVTAPVVSSRSSRKRLEAKPEKTTSEPSRVRDAIALYHEHFVAKYGRKPEINGAKDGATLKRLIQHRGYDEVADLLRRFFETDDAFIENSGRTIGVFSSVVNKLIVQQGAKTDRHSVNGVWAGKTEAREVKL
jgi:hypothetical protein